MELKDIPTAAGSTNPTMSRTFRRKKKSVHNSVDQKTSDSAMDKNPFIQSTLVRWEKILGKLPHRSNYSSTEYRKRLAGGADKDIVGSNSIASPMGAKNLTSNGSTTRFAMPQIRETQYLTHNHSQAISEKNVDEVIDCAIQNLQEAGKALATLGDNHERELKLTVMDALAKFQKWIDVVQKKMEAAKYDVNSIRKALAAQTIVLTAKDREVLELRAQLAECEANYAAHKKALAQNQSNEVERHDISQVAGAPHVVASISTGLSPDVTTHDSPTIVVPLGVTPPLFNNDKSAGGLPVSQIETDGSQLAPNSVLIPEQTDPRQDASEQSHGSAIPTQQNSAGSPCRNPPVINAGTMTGDVAAPSSPRQEPLPSNQDQQPDGRVVELEAELMELRNENERMKKDHAEYENAIQRALLQGISSLNAEALKVLKNPPFICYKPCEPCNPQQPFSPSDMAEAVPCVLRAPYNHVSQRGAKSSSSRVGAICQPYENGVHSSSRKQATRVCYAPAKRSSQNSMLFLLPQQHIDCACTAVEYCVCTNYGRAGRIFSRERAYGSSRVTAGRDGFRGGLVRSYTREPPCYRNR